MKNHSRKILSFLIAIIMILTLAACGQSDEVLRLGENFKIVDIDYEQMILTVKDLRIPPVIEGEFDLTCKGVPIIYCNYEKADAPEALQDLDFDDLTVGDEIIVTVYEEQLESLKDPDSDKILKVNQIQLGTQRIN